MSRKTFMQQLSAVCFWDIDKELFDPNRYPAHIIPRVLESGTLDDWRLLRTYYGLDKIVEVCKNVRTLDAVSLAFICAISGTKKGGLQMLSYQTAEPHTLELLRQLMEVPLLRQARLVGGTALALQYGHRSSVDLHFFGKWRQQPKN